MNDCFDRRSRELWLNLWKRDQAVWQLKGVTKFRDLGHSVVGVEFVEECVRSYFKEHDLEMEETTCPIINCKILQTPDRRLQVLVCNILDFKRECTGPVDIVWDRSGFAAMKKEDRPRPLLRIHCHEDDRPRYAAKLKSSWPQTSRMACGLLFTTNPCQLSHILQARLAALSGTHYCEQMRKVSTVQLKGLHCFINGVLRVAPRSTAGAVIKENFGDIASKILFIDSRELEMAPFLKAAGGATASLWHLSP